MRRTLPLLIGAALVTLAAAQIGGIGRDRIPGIPGLDSAFKKGDPITTSLADAKFEAKDQEYPRLPLRALAELQRTPVGGFVLQTGLWGAALQSY